MKTAEFLPWHRQTAAAWLGNRDRFAHAWLVHGLAGTGLREFVFAAAAFATLCFVLELPAATQATRPAAKYASSDARTPTMHRMMAGVDREKSMSTVRPYITSRQIQRTKPADRGKQRSVRRTHVATQRPHCDCACVVLSLIAG